jgi:hypothetical protein
VATRAELVARTDKCFRANGQDIPSSPHGAETQLKLLRIAVDYDWMAMRAAAFELQQADELTRSFANLNTKRPIGSADLIRSPDTSRASP